MNKEYMVGDMVWVETGTYSASKARIMGIHDDGYYVKFIDKTIYQEEVDNFPVLKTMVRPIDYIGLYK
jgi:hypothetical protein